MQSLTVVSAIIVVNFAHCWISAHKTWIGRTSELFRSTTGEVGVGEVPNNDHELRFSGIGRLFSNDEMASRDVLSRLKTANVIVVGLGGVGSWATEMLCRSGIGRLALIDLDEICISNINRQLHALSSSVGKMKIDEMKHRLWDINPKCNVTLVYDFMDANNVHSIIRDLQPTALLDAIDGGKVKGALLAACTDLGVPVVTCGASAGLTDPTQITCMDITKVKGDKLISVCRRSMRKYYRFPVGRPFGEVRRVEISEWNIDCVVSLEQTKQVVGELDNSSFRRCDGALGTAGFVTGTFGFTAAGRVVQMIAMNHLKSPIRP